MSYKPERKINLGDIRISIGWIAFDLSELSKIHLPANVCLPFENKEFPFFSKKILFDDKIEVIHIHNKVIAAFFELDFDLVNFHTRIHFKDIDFNRKTVDDCYYKFLDGYKNGLENFKSIVQERIGLLNPYEPDNIGNAVFDVAQKYNMLYDNLINSSIEPFYNYGFNNAIFYKCWETLFSDSLGTFQEKLKKKSLLEDGRILLDIDIDTAKEYFNKLLCFEHKKEIHKILTEEQLDNFLRANFIGFGEKTDFNPVALPRDFKTVIRRYFRDFDRKHHTDSHIIAYVNLLIRCFTNFKGDKYESLYSNFSK